MIGSWIATAANDKDAELLQQFGENVADNAGSKTADESAAFTADSPLPPDVPSCRCRTW